MATKLHPAMGVCAAVAPLSSGIAEGAPLLFTREWPPHPRAVRRLLPAPCVLGLPILLEGRHPLCGAGLGSGLLQSPLSFSDQ